MLQTITAEKNSVQSRTSQVHQICSHYECSKLRASLLKLITSCKRKTEWIIVFKLNSNTRIYVQGRLWAYSKEKEHAALGIAYEIKILNRITIGKNLKVKSDDTAHQILTRGSVERTTIIFKATERILQRPFSLSTMACGSKNNKTEI